MTIHEKYEVLRDILVKTGRTAVAFSGGVDSTFLLKCAFDVLRDDALAVLVVSAGAPEREISEARDIASLIGSRLMEVEADVLNLKGYCENPPDRCYHCKKAIFGRILDVASEYGIEVVVEGSNVDDMKDYRPGIKALKELNIGSPLKEAGLEKDEIRALSKELGLPTWNKSSYACLATRFPYGTEITGEGLKRVEKAENFLLEKGFEIFRVRHHGDIARIELRPDRFHDMIKGKNRISIINEFKKLGYTYVTIDLQGYRSGSMNEVL